MGGSSGVDVLGVGTPAPRRRASPRSAVSSRARPWRVRAVLDLGVHAAAGGRCRAGPPAEPEPDRRCRAGRRSGDASRRERGARSRTQLEDRAPAVDQAAEPSTEAQLDATQAPGGGRPDQAPSGRQLGPNQLEEGVHPGHPRRRLEDPVRHHGEGECVMRTGEHRHPGGGASRGHQICLSLRRRLRVFRGQHDDFLVGPVGHDPQQSSGRAAGHSGDAAEATGSDNCDQHVKPRLRRPDIALRAFARGEPPSRGPCWQRKGSPVPVRG